MVPALTAKLAEVEPCGTVTELAGNGKSVLPLESNTSFPPEGAIPVNRTVQVAVKFEVKLVGVQESCETDTTCPITV
jgi:hypothetical protein